MNGDSFFARVDYGPMSLTSFGMIAEPPALLCRDDALVDQGAVAPTPCLSLGEMRMIITAGGLLPAGTASTAMRTIFSRPLPSWTLDEKTKKSKPDKLQPACTSLLEEDCRNQGRLWCFIPAIVQVAYEADCF